MKDKRIITKEKEEEGKRRKREGKREGRDARGERILEGSEIRKDKKRRKRWI